MTYCNKILKKCLAVATLSTMGFTAQSADKVITPDDFLIWVKQNQSAQVNFKDGDKITFDNADSIRAFVPPGYQDEMIFDGMEVVVRDATDLSPPEVYNTATNKFYGQASIGDNDALENYTAGLPFDPDKLSTDDPQAGAKAAWNFNFRWQHQGLEIPNLHWIWVRAGGDHKDHSVMKTEYGSNYQGGGQFERVLEGTYQRAYFTHRSDLADKDYKLSGGWTRNTEFRELTDFNSPFDISGTGFLVLRHQDAEDADDSWAYVPSLRRVRRISVEVKSDSLLGTDHTLEDFYCFAGRVPEHEWKYIGKVRMLAVARSRTPETVYYGPNGWTPKDDWELRTVNVYQQIPKSSSHPYSSKFIMTDNQNSESYYCNAFDRKGELWKVWSLTKVWTEDPQYSGETPKGIQMSSFQSINVIDKQNNRGTLVPTHKSGYPAYTEREIRRRFDVNTLTEGN